MKSSKIFWAFALMCILVLQFQCSGSRTIASNRPGWVDQGGAFYSGDKGKAFYGVGAASNMSMVSLRRTTADTQARADLSRIFKSEISNLVKVYQREIVQGIGDASAAEQVAQEVTTGLTQMDLTGSQIIDRFYDSVEQTQYSLCILDLSNFKQNIEQMRQLSREIQEIILNNADKAFAELEEAKIKK